MSLLLDFEKDILFEISESSSLTCLATGLPLEYIIQCYVQVHCIPENLVLVCNHSLNEANTIINNLARLGEKFLPRIITSEISQKERLKEYSKGGIIFISTQILVMDLLLEKFDASKVNQILLMRCHELEEFCQDTFCIRLLREKNSLVDVKAFSDHAISLTFSQNNAEVMMQQLGIPKMCLWPRFRIELVKFFDNLAPAVQEIKVEMPYHMSVCHAALVELIQGIINEIKFHNPLLKKEEDFTCEAVIGNSLSKLINHYADLQWNTMNTTTKQLLSELFTLKSFLFKLGDINPLIFWKMINQVKQNEIALVKSWRYQETTSVRSKSGSTWLLMDSSGKLCEHAKKRVFKTDIKSEFNFEHNPKCSTIDEIIKEIHSQRKSQKAIRVMILVGSESTSDLLEKFLEGGELLVDSWMSQREDDTQSSVEIKDDQFYNPTESLMPTGCRELRVIGSKLLSRMFYTIFNNSLSHVANFRIVIRSPPLGCGETGSGSPDSGGYNPNGSLCNALNQYLPTHIITFQPRLNWIRQIETYTCRTPFLVDESKLPMNPAEDQIHVYFVQFKNSVEEQRFLLNIKREKEAFERLIEINSKFVLSTKESRLAQFPSELEGEVEKPTVLVDTREFRSELPPILHYKGIKIVPEMLSVADYILAPHLCVERKSVSDLIGSFKSGRLVEQCRSMKRFYANPILLIEFHAHLQDQSDSVHSWNTRGSFSTPFVDKYSLSNLQTTSGGLNSHHLLSQLVQLTINFPMLRLFWSVKPQQTAELFFELKMGRAEPSIDKLPKSSDDHYDEFNAEPFDLLRRIPGINSKNEMRILNRVDSLVALCRLTIDELTDILESAQTAREIHNFLHNPWTPVNVGEGESALNNALKRRKKNTKFHLAGKLKKS